MKKSLLAFLLLFPLSSYADDAPESKVSVAVGFGFSQPVSGTWGKEYKSSSAANFRFDYRAYPQYKFGAEIGYDTGHANISVKNCKPAILYFTPYLKESKYHGPWEFYGLIGAGLYERRTPAYTDENSAIRYGPNDSSKLGFNGGFGIVFKPEGEFLLGLDIRLHEIPKFVGIGTSLATGTNLVPTFTLQKNF